MSLAPVVLFVYNRPEHTRRTLEALKANKIARKSDLYIFADGVKKDANNTQHILVQQVRRTIRADQWAGNIFIEESRENKGLAASVLQGVGKVMAKHGKAIVLEDDVVVSTGFLSYMNAALDLYEEEKKVMHIAGYMLPVEAELPETFFYNSTSCWGWATWASAWQELNTDATALLAQLKEKNLLGAFNLEGAVNFDQQLKDNISGKIKTWAAKWNASVLLKGGLSLHPKRSLVKNIGFDGTGEHCHISSAFDAGQLAKNIPVKKIDLIESQIARNAAKAFMQNQTRPSFSFRAKRKLQRLFKMA